ncbi:MAG: hypothetical protein WB608_19875, partial [Terracidiphilus sp.]
MSQPQGLGPCSETGYESTNAQPVYFRKPQPPVAYRRPCVHYCPNSLFASHPAQDDTSLKGGRLAAGKYRTTTKQIPLHYG